MNASITLPLQNGPVGIHLPNTVEIKARKTALRSELLIVERLSAVAVRDPAGVGIPVGIIHISVIGAHQSTHILAATDGSRRIRAPYITASQASRAGDTASESADVNRTGDAARGIGVDDLGATLDASHRTADDLSTASVDISGGEGSTQYSAIFADDSADSLSRTDDVTVGKTGGHHGGIKEGVVRIAPHQSSDLIGATDRARGVAVRDAARLQAHQSTDSHVAVDIAGSIGVRDRTGGSKVRHAHVTDQAAYLVGTVDRSRGIRIIDRPLISTDEPTDDILTGDVAIGVRVLHGRIAFTPVLAQYTADSTDESAHKIRLSRRYLAGGVGIGQSPIGTKPTDHSAHRLAATAGADVSRGRRIGDRAADVVSADEAADGGGARCGDVAMSLRVPDIARTIVVIVTDEPSDICTKSLDIRVALRLRDDSVVSADQSADFTVSADGTRKLGVVDRNRGVAIAHQATDLVIAADVAIGDR